jgi:inner membrane protein
VDNLTHTLAGAALGQAGLKRVGGLAMPALMIGANLPDVDVLGLFFGENLAWRRGWTHGPLGLAVLPVLLAWMLVGFDRWQQRRGTRPANRLPVRFGSVLLLCYIGTLSHPLLDYFNTYGIRCLTPFSERWFYGDVLFIIDPWVWLLLGFGIWLSRRRESKAQAGTTAPAWVALGLVTLYSASMGAVGRIAEHHAANEFQSSGLGTPTDVLASPVFADPFRREIVVRTADSYGFGAYDLFQQQRLTLDSTLVPSHMDDPAIDQAAHQDKAVADFLYWSRYPFATIEHKPEGIDVIIGDARYGRRPDSSRFSVSTTLLPE